MGINDITDAPSDGQHITQEFLQGTISALKGDIVPRTSSGVPAASAGSAGTRVFPFSAVHTEQLFVKGKEFSPGDSGGSGPGSVTAGSTIRNGVVSGLAPAGRPGMCGWLHQAGSNGVVITATTGDPLVVKLDGASYERTANITGGSIPTDYTRTITPPVATAGVSATYGGSWAGDRTPLNADRAKYRYATGGEFEFHDPNAAEILPDSYGQNMVIKSTGGASGTTYTYCQRISNSASEAGTRNIAKLKMGESWNTSTSSQSYSAWQMPFHTTHRVIRCGALFVDPLNSTWNLTISSRIVGAVNTDLPAVAGYATGDVVFRESDQRWYRFSGSGWDRTSFVFLAFLAIDGGQVEAVMPVRSEESLSDMFDKKFAVLGDPVSREGEVDGDLIRFGGQNSDTETKGFAELGGQQFNQIGTSAVVDTSDGNAGTLTNNEMFCVYLDVDADTYHFEPTPPIWQIYRQRLLLVHPNRQRLYVGSFSTDNSGNLVASQRISTPNSVAPRNKVAEGDDDGFFISNPCLFGRSRLTHVYEGNTQTFRRMQIRVQGRGTLSSGTNTYRYRWRGTHHWWPGRYITREGWDELFYSYLTPHVLEQVEYDTDGNPYLVVEFSQWDESSLLYAASLSEAAREGRSRGIAGGASSSSEDAGVGGAIASVDTPQIADNAVGQSQLGYGSVGIEQLDTNNDPVDGQVLAVSANPDDPTQLRLDWVTGTGGGGGGTDFLISGTKETGKFIQATGTGANSQSWVTLGFGDVSGALASEADVFDDPSANTGLVGNKTLHDAMQEVENELGAFWSDWSQAPAVEFSSIAASGTISVGDTIVQARNSSSFNVRTSAVTASTLYLAGTQCAGLPTLSSGTLRGGLLFIDSEGRRVFQPIDNPESPDSEEYFIDQSGAWVAKAWNDEFLTSRVRGLPVGGAFNGVAPHAHGLPTSINTFNDEACIGMRSENVVSLFRCVYSTSDSEYSFLRVNQETEIPIADDQIVTRMIADRQVTGAKLALDSVGINEIDAQGQAAGRHLAINSTNDGLVFVNPPTGGGGGGNFPVGGVQTSDRLIISTGTAAQSWGLLSDANVASNANIAQSKLADITLSDLPIHGTPTNGQVPTYSTSNSRLEFADGGGGSGTPDDGSVTIAKIASGAFADETDVLTSGTGDSNLASASLLRSLLADVDNSSRWSPWSTTATQTNFTPTENQSTGTITIGDFSIIYRNNSSSSALTSSVFIALFGTNCLHMPTLSSGTLQGLLVIVDGAGTRWGIPIANPAGPDSQAVFKRVLASDGVNYEWEAVDRASDEFRTNFSLLPQVTNINTYEIFNPRAMDGPADSNLANEILVARSDGYNRFAVRARYNSSRFEFFSATSGVRTPPILSGSIDPTAFLVIGGSGAAGSSLSVVGGEQGFTDYRWVDPIDNASGGTRASGKVIAATSGSAQSWTDLEDLIHGTPTDDQVVAWDNDNSRLYFKDDANSGGGGGGLTIGGTQASGKVIAATSSSAQSWTDLEDLVNGTPTDDQVVAWDATNSRMYWKTDANSGGGGGGLTIGGTQANHSLIKSTGTDAQSWGLLTNDNVDSSAAIAQSKLNLSITNSEVASNAAIAQSKLAAITASDLPTIPYSKLSGTPSIPTQLPPTDGSVTEPKLAAHNTPSDDQVLAWDATNSRMYWKDDSAGSTFTIGGTQASGKIISATSSSAQSWSDLEDLIHGTPTDDQIVAWDSTNSRLYWKNDETGGAGTPADGSITIAKLASSAFADEEDVLVDGTGDSNLVSASLLKGLLADADNSVFYGDWSSAETTNRNTPLPVSGVVDGLDIGGTNGRLTLRNHSGFNALTQGISGITLYGTDCAGLPSLSGGRTLRGVLVAEDSNGVRYALPVANPSEQDSQAAFKRVTNALGSSWTAIDHRSDDLRATFGALPTDSSWTPISAAAIDGPSGLNLQGEVIFARSDGRKRYAIGINYASGNPDHFIIYTSSAESSFILRAGEVDTTELADEAVTEAKMDIHNSPSDGDVLKYTTANGLEWGSEDSGLTIGGTQASGKVVAATSASAQSWTDLEDLIHGTPTNGQVPTYSTSNSRLEFVTPSVPDNSITQAKINGNMRYQYTTLWSSSNSNGDRNNNVTQTLNTGESFQDYVDCFMVFSDGGTTNVKMSPPLDVHWVLDNLSSFGNNIEVCFTCGDLHSVKIRSNNTFAYYIESVSQRALRLVGRKLEIEA